MKLLDSGLNANATSTAPTKDSADEKKPVDDAPKATKKATKKTAKSKTKKSDTPEPEPVVETETETGTDPDPDSEDLLADVNTDDGEGGLLDL